jgi:hypothetical protein
MQMAAEIRYELGERGKDCFPLYYTERILIHAGHQKKLYLGDRSNKVCRFCGRDSSATRFSKVAHLLPQFMGNNMLFSHFECDECNALFSKYETAFTNYFGIHHTLARLKGKNKIPNYTSKKEDFRVECDAEKIGVYSGVYNDSVTIYEEKKKMTVTTIRPSYIPQDVLKCIVKIGMCAIGEQDLKYFEPTRKWLLSDSANTTISQPFSIVYYNIGGALRAKVPFVTLFQKRPNAPVPQLAVIIGYDHFKLQFFMPFDNRDSALFQGAEVVLPIQQHLVRDREDGKGLAFFWKDFSGSQKVIAEQHTFSMGILPE